MNTTNHGPRVYLAGPDVFYPDAKERFESMRRELAGLGFVAVTPLDGEAGEPSAVEIYKANLIKVANSQFVLANVNPFRGTEPDSGTVFEIGFAVALGKRVFTYSEAPGSVIDRLGDYIAAQPETAGQFATANDEDDKDTVFPDGMKCECFGLPLNLMLAVSCTHTHGKFRHAARRLAQAR